jgi:hypothetical protein
MALAAQANSQSRANAEELERANKANAALHKQSRANEANAALHAQSRATQAKAPNTYSKNQFVIWSHSGYDIENNPIQNTLDGCQLACDNNPVCKGFSRATRAIDNQVNQCYLKNNVNNARDNNNRDWVTYVKNT